MEERPDFKCQKSRGNAVGRAAQSTFMSEQEADPSAETHERMRCLPRSRTPGAHMPEHPPRRKHGEGDRVLPDARLPREGQCLREGNGEEGESGELEDNRRPDQGDP